jgi:hypothetical protein
MSFHHCHTVGKVNYLLYQDKIFEFAQNSKTFFVQLGFNLLLKHPDITCRSSLYNCPHT